MGVMSRAALGHTGHPLVVSRPVVVAYCCVAVAPIPRIFLPLLLPGFYGHAMLAAALLWIVGFSLFCWVFIPILVPPGSKSCGAGSP